MNQASLTDYLKAGLPVLHLITSETDRAIAMISGAAQTCKTHAPVVFNAATGALEYPLEDVNSVRRMRAFSEYKPTAVMQNPVKWMQQITDTLLKEAVAEAEEIEEAEEAKRPVDPKKRGQPMVLIAPDMHLLWGKDSIQWPISAEFNALRAALVQHGSMLVIIGNRENLPPELREIAMCQRMDLPSPDEYQHAAEVILDANPDLQNKQPTPEEWQKIMDAARGLTCEQFTNAVTLSTIREGKIDAKTIYREKVEQLNRTGFLKVMEPRYTVDQVGGFFAFKTWLAEQKRALTLEARKAGIASPRGGLFCGPPGSGKSLASEMTASALDLPLIQLNFGALFGGIIGESEQNTRTAIDTIEALSPCVCWVNN